jgi:peptidoglycan hydrolase CwlO-like protein
MPPTNSQPSVQPNDAAANLAMATHISTQLATPQQPLQGAETPLQTMQDTHDAPDLTATVEALQKQVDALQKQVDKEPQDDIKEMRQMIEQALAEDDTNDGK